MRLAPLLTLDADLGPIVSVGSTPRGHIRLVSILGGTFRGEGIRGRILPGGNDWQELRSDSVLEIRAHYLLETEQGECIEVRSEGLRAGRPEVLARLGRGDPVLASEYYFRTAIRFSAPSGRLGRYNDLLAVSRGERLPEAVRLSIFEVL